MALLSGVEGGGEGGGKGGLGAPSFSGPVATFAVVALALAVSWIPATAKFLADHRAARAMLRASCAMAAQADGMGPRLKPASRKQAMLRLSFALPIHVGLIHLLTVALVGALMGRRISGAPDGVFCPDIMVAPRYAGAVATATVAALLSAGVMQGFGGLRVLQRGMSEREAEDASEEERAELEALAMVKIAAVPWCFAFLVLLLANSRRGRAWSPGSAAILLVLSGLAVFAFVYRKPKGSTPTGSSFVGSKGWLGGRVNRWTANINSVRGSIV